MSRNCAQLLLGFEGAQGLGGAYAVSEGCPGDEQASAGLS